MLISRHTNVWVSRKKRDGILSAYKEGADIVMIKPGMPYLDLISLVKENFKIPVFSYQVSGEYALIENGIKKGLISKKAILESLISFKRAGATAIITYYADKVSKLIQ